jgi:hypothetical protein
MSRAAYCKLASASHGLTVGWNLGTIWAIPVAPEPML